MVADFSQCESKIQIETESNINHDYSRIVYIGCSSCSGTAALTGLYALSFCCLSLQINHIPEADNPIINVTKTAKNTIRWFCCHHVLQYSENPNIKKRGCV
jgi:hypothetical protein